MKHLFLFFQLARRSTKQFDRALLFLLLAGTRLSISWAAEYRSADLPSVLEFIDGSSVESMEDWSMRREEIKKQWFDTYLGHFPEAPPRILDFKMTGQIERDDGVRVRNVLLTFDTPNQASFEIRLLLPKLIRVQENQHAPLLLTQPRHYQIAWGEAAVKRGYVVCFYPGVDYNHREEDFPGYENVWRTFQKEYPDASWSSSLAIQSWLASRSLDFLLSDQSGIAIDSKKIGIIGHSRYGKQSLYAAAFDERITAVVSRSAGSPAAAGYRFTGRDTFMETVLDAPQEWALPGLKAYFGRENELPVESNGLLALIAPRHCLLHTAYNDGSDPTFAVERSYLEAKSAFQFNGTPQNIALLYRKGNHNPITEDHIRQNLDWFDWAFERGQVERSDFPETLLHHFSWKQWESIQANSDLIPPGQASDIKQRVQWMLGEKPAVMDALNARPLKIIQDEERGVAVWSRDRWKPEGVVRLPVAFGANVQGNLTFESDHQGPMPVVIWLHPFNYSHGSNEGYGVEGTTVYYRLAQAGYAVLSFDQCGFGDRLLEGASFYEEYPKWSKMGRMVFDVSCAVDFVHGLRGLASGELPLLNKEQIILLGYSLGGMVAMHTAALDDRLTGVASFCGFTPFRTDTDASSEGGIRRWWEWHGLLPKLGLFHGREADVPYDYGDLLDSFSLRPCLVYSATRDRHCDSQAVAECVNQSGGQRRVSFIQSNDVNRFQSDQHAVLLNWLRSLR